MKLSELIKQLQEIEKKEGGDTQCGSIQSTVGCSYYFELVSFISCKEYKNDIVKKYRIPKKFIAIE